MSSLIHLFPVTPKHQWRFAPFKLCRNLISTTTWHVCRGIPSSSRHCRVHQKYTLNLPPIAVGTLFICRPKVFLWVAWGGVGEVEWSSRGVVKSTFPRLLWLRRLGFFFYWKLSSFHGSVVICNFGSGTLWPRVNVLVQVEKEGAFCWSDVKKLRGNLFFCGEQCSNLTWIDCTAGRCGSLIVHGLVA